MNGSKFSLIFIFIVFFLCLTLFGQKIDIVRAQAGGAATLQDFWDGNASFAFQYTIPAGSNCNPDSGEIVPMDGVWYRFARDFYNCGTSNAQGRLVVEKSSDQGKTWTNRTIIIDNTAGSPYEWMAVDGDAYYDVQTTTWHYLFQCIAHNGGWNLCHASRVGRDPMGPFTPDPNNPVVKGGDLWKRICDQSTDDCKILSTGSAVGGVVDEGTPDILKKVNGEYVVSFHGYDGVNGYRGIASTPDFVNWKIGSQAVSPLAEDDIFDKKDCASWDSWDPSTGCIGGGAADMLEENGYYYMFIEAADKNLAIIAGTKWDFGFLRSNSLANTTWEQKNTASVYSHYLNGGGGIGYGKLFRDESGQIYMVYLREEAGVHEYLMKLEKNDDLALYQFREGSGNVTRSDLVRFGDYDANVYNVSWQSSGVYDNQLVFNGQNSYVDFLNHPDFNRTDTVFMEVKAKIGSAPIGKSALLAGKVGSYWAEIYNTSLCFWVNSAAKGNVNACVPLGNLIGAENTYQFLYDGSTLKIGVNGAQAAQNFIGNSKINISSTNFRIGGSYAPSANFYGSFSGSVDYLRLAKTGTIAPACSNSCSSGATQCSGLGYQTCGDTNNDGCAEWSDAMPCASGQTCQGGTCAAQLVNNAAFVSQPAIPSTMTAGQTYSVSVTMKNTGTSIWTAADKYRLGSQNPQDNSTWGLSRVNLDPGESIAPGQQKTFTFSIKAPATNGTYNFQWQMLKENVEWFGDKTANVAVAVTAGPQPCVSKICSQLGYNCGTASDGCGGALSCGTCSTGQSCTDNSCVPSCVAKTCAVQGYSCGSQSDGCDGSLDCGSCPSGKTCSTGVCVAASSGGGGGGSSGGGGNANPPVQPVVTKPVAKMTRAQILAAITKIQALIADLQKQMVALAGGTAAFSCISITKNLFYGMAKDSQVKCLQEVLKSQGYAVAVSGNYDAATKTAVAQFQQKYASEILATSGLKYGSGNVGNATRAKINQIVDGK